MNDLLAYQRDHSWYIGSHGGSGGKYHLMGNDLASKCRNSRMLDDSNGVVAGDLPTELLCRKCFPKTKSRNPEP
jgi:hypothetical protein